MNRPTLILVVSLLAALPACRCSQGEQGPLPGAQKDTSFVRSSEAIFFSSGRGWERMRLDGSQRKVVFPGRHSIADISPDGKTFALLDDGGRLLLSDPRDGKLQQVAALGQRTAGAVFSPGGETLACWRRADLDLPQAEQKEDDAVLLVNVARLTARTLAAASRRQPTRVDWTAGGEALRLKFRRGQMQLVKVTSGAREPLKEGIKVALFSGRHHLKPPTTCAKRKARLELRGRGGDNGLDLVDPTSSQRLVILDGDKRGFHDRPPAVRNPFFSRDCQHVVFALLDHLWVVEAGGRKVGRLVRGSRAFLAPGH